MSVVVKLSQRRRTFWVVAGGVSTAVAGYAVYKYWLEGYVSGGWIAVRGAASDVSRLLNTMGAASDLSSIVMDDLKTFLQSDCDEVPRSVRQLLKLSRSPEFQQGVLVCSQNMTQGVVKGLAASSSSGAESREPQTKGIVDAVLDKFFTEEGKSFASAVCARMARAVVTSMQGPPPGAPRQLTTSESPTHSSASGDQDQSWQAVLITAFSTGKGKELAALIVQTFAVNCVGTFLDKTEGVNMYSDIVAGIGTNPELVKEVTSHVLASSIKEVVSHWRNRNMVTPGSGGTSSTSSFTSSPRAKDIRLTPLTDSEAELQPCFKEPGQSPLAVEVGQYLSQPEIRSFMLDVTGVVTSRGMEAFLLILLHRMFGAQGVMHLEGSAADKMPDECGNNPGLKYRQPRPWLDSRVIASRALATATVCLAVALNYLNLCS